LAATGGLGTQEKATVFSACSGPMQTLLNASDKLVVEIAFQLYFEEYAYVHDSAVTTQLVTRHFHGFLLTAES
jgi:hypothetical protein